ncbi:MAG: kelch repeat-containing protein [Pirellulales bacterium]
MAGVSRTGGYLSNVEVVDLKAENRAEPKFTRWEVKFDGDAKQSQFVLQHAGGLFAMGGNRSRDTHGSDSFSRQALRFDVANRAVEKLPDMPRELRSGTLAASGRGRDQILHAMGGLALTDGQYGSTNNIYSYNPREKAWLKDTVVMPTQRSMFRVGRHDDQLYIFGGSELIDGKRGIGSVLWRWTGKAGDAVEIVEGKPLPHPRRSGGGAQLGSRYYLVGGLGADGKVVAGTDVFDMASQTWTAAAAPQVPRWFGMVAAAEGKLYLSGGLKDFSDAQSAISSLEVYDPKSDKWTTLLEKQPADCASMQIFEYQGRLLYYGLHPEKDGVATFALLDPTPLSEQLAE